MPPANNIVFSDNMVTSSVGVQSACPSSPTYTNLYGDNNMYDDISPSHFTDIQRTKLEDTFSRKQKPDDIQLQIIAMECNLLYKDVRDWFKARRIKWIEELVRTESMVVNSNSYYSNHSRYTKNDTNNNNTTAATTSGHNSNTTAVVDRDCTASTNGLLQNHNNHHHHHHHKKNHVTHSLLYSKHNNNIEVIKHTNTKKSSITSSAMTSNHSSSGNDTTT